MIPTSIPPGVTAFRAAHRARHIGPRYHGWLHFSVTTVGALATIVFAAWQLTRPSAVELSSIVLFFAIANLGEYLGHRGPMHHRKKWAAVLFDRHTQQHHRFYTHEAMACESHKDFQMVLFPPVMLFFFLGVLALPIGALLYLTIAPNVGWLWAATVMSYFLTYEWLHFAYHLPHDSWVGRRALVRWLRRHHQAHHDPRLMTRTNFNITFPIADYVFGTVARREAAPDLQATSSGIHNR
jgi:hypothetical protein